MTTDTYDYNNRTEDLNEGWDDDQPIVTDDDLDNTFEGIDTEDDDDDFDFEPIE